MSNKHYNSFVRPVSPNRNKTNAIQARLNGEEARRLYLEEVKDITEPTTATNETYHKVQSDKSILKHKLYETELSDKDLFVSVQNDDADTARRILDTAPDKINIVDDYGWSLLMIACQANAIETARELIKRGADTSVRDKAGNSAQSLVIKNRNLILAGILLDSNAKKSERKKESKHKKVKLKEHFLCDVCHKTFPDKHEHLSSTIHNINASRGKKIPTKYVIPESNKGYQLMLKVGWDKESGLGPEGTGTMYPIRTVQKKDRKGLGHGKQKDEKLKPETVKRVNRKTFARDYQNSRKMEIDFRRQFY